MVLVWKQMYCEGVGCFWLPGLLTVALIFLAFPVLNNFIKTRKRSGNGIIPTPTPTPTSGSGEGSVGREYEVFLSFRGTDTRKGFTDFLYTYLVGATIHTFRDNDKLHVGDDIGPELLKAIKESKISIPIFSKNYAYSKWCLRELAQMVECHNTEGQKIFPIYYDIEPSHVRNQEGTYKEAFLQHTKSSNEKTVHRWRDALRKVGELKGLELNKETDGHEGELVKKVVEKVLLELKKNYTHVPDNLVGMDHHIEEMEGLLNVNSNDVRIVGIHGMGGIGKTTIAKVIYNQLCARFVRCCFLEDVREKSHHNGLVNLQNQLLSKILKGEFGKIVDVDEGINRIKDVVSRKKVFVVLDDMDEKFQFDKLAGQCDWFGAGSRIIITTRNKEVLDALEVYGSYEPQLMNLNHSLQLFSKYAFMRDFPPEDYRILSKEVVSTAAGLPLVLVTIGSLLFGKEDKALWEEKLRKLKKIPHEKVLEKLRISLEALDYQQKQIFLDIACLFIGCDKLNPFYMWNDCEFYPTDGINVLVLRSLVKVGDDNRLRMHDQIRDLGRQIVREENLSEPGERSRLWHHEEALNLLERHMVTKKVVALCLDLRPEHYLVGEAFWQLPNLRFLRVDNTDLDGDFKHILSYLRWLQWRRCPGKFTPTNCYLKNLVILDLSYSQITDDWEGLSQIKMAKKLKVLNLSHCYYLTGVPHLTSFATLESLDVQSCRGLHRLDGLEQLKSLRYLAASACVSLVRLPDLSNLRKLKKFDTNGCSKLIEVPGLDKLESLELMEMNGCKSVERLPDLSNIRKLKKLKIKRCYKLTEIQGLDILVSLEHLDMGGCSSMERLPDLSNLGMLKHLDLFYCKKLREVEGLRALESLESLDVSYCRPVEKIPDLSKFKNLKTLRLRGLKHLTEIRGLEELESLELLDIYGCKSIEKLPDLSNLKNLKEINVSFCVKLTEIKGLVELKSLALLKIYGCKSLEYLSYLPSTRTSQRQRRNRAHQVKTQDRDIFLRESPDENGSVGTCFVLAKSPLN